MSKKKIVIIITVIIAIIISVGVAVTYKNINTTKKLEDFNEYIEEYKIQISNYIIDKNKDKYEEMLSASEKLVENKDVKGIDNLKEEFIKLKEEFVQANLELINNNIAGLEEEDISKLENKELIQGKIDEIKILRDDNKFIEANELSISLKEDINKKLESIKLEEARIEEKKREEEEAKRLEEEKKKAKEEAKLIEMEDDGFTKREALEYIENKVVAYFTDQMNLTEYDNGDFEYIPNDPKKNSTIGVYFTKNSDSSYEFTIKSIININGKRDSMTQERGTVYSDGRIKESSF